MVPHLLAFTGLRPAIEFQLQLLIGSGRFIGQFVLFLGRVPVSGF
jgi:hypothetical protein